MDAGKNVRHKGESSNDCRAQDIYYRWTVVRWVGSAASLVRVLGMLQRELDGKLQRGHFQPELPASACCNRGNRGNRRPRRPERWFWRPRRQPLRQCAGTGAILL